MLQRVIGSGKPMMSPELAESVASWSNLALIASLLLAAVFAVLMLLSGNVRVANLRDEVGALQTQLAEAQTEQAKATAELNRIKTPRTLRPEQQSRVADRLRPFAGMRFSVAVQPDQEPIDLMDQLIGVLQQAGWLREQWKGRAGITLKRSNQPDIVAGIALFSGVRIEVAQSKAQEWGGAVVALRDALKAEGLEVTATASRSAIDDAIHLGIGKKP